MHCKVIARYTKFGNSLLFYLTFLCNCANKHIPTSFSKSTLPAHHQCLPLAPPTVTHSPPEPLHTDLHSALTLPLSTNKTKISRATLRLGSGVSLTDNTDYWRRIVAIWWWWLCYPWTLLQWTLISSAAHIVSEYGSVATSKEGSSQRNGPCVVKLKISNVSHHKTCMA